MVSIVNREDISNLDSKEYDLSDNEISLYNVKVNYANKEMIRDFERTVFS